MKTDVTIRQAMKKYLGDALAWQALKSAKQKESLTSIDATNELRRMEILEQTCYDALITFGFTTIWQLENCDETELANIQKFLNEEYYKRLQLESLL